MLPKIHVCALYGDALQLTTSFIKGLKKHIAVILLCMNPWMNPYLQVYICHHFNFIYQQLKHGLKLERADEKKIANIKMKAATFDIWIYIVPGVHINTKIMWFVYGFPALHLVLYIKIYMPLFCFVLTVMGLLKAIVLIIQVKFLRALSV